MGGISVNRCLVARTVCQYGLALLWGLVQERWWFVVVGWCLAHCWVLRQQDREGLFFPGLFVSGFLAAPVACTESVCGVCGTGLLFENYIVDASILYKKQFPRY